MRLLEYKIACLKICTFMAVFFHEAFIFSLHRSRLWFFFFSSRTCSNVLFTIPHSLTHLDLFHMLYTIFLPSAWFHFSSFSHLNFAVIFNSPFFHFFLKYCDTIATPSYFLYLDSLIWFVCF